MMWTLLLGLLLLVSSVCAGADEPVTALIAQNGRVALTRGRKALGHIQPGLFEKEWKHAGLGGADVRQPPSRDVRRGRIKSPGGTMVDCELQPEVKADGVVLRYRLTPQAAAHLNSLHVAWDFDAATGIGATFTADGESGSLPEAREKTGLRSAPTRDLRLAFRSGGEVRLQFESPTQVLIQDNRQWGPSFTIRIGPQMDAKEPWPAGKALDLAFTLSASGGVKADFDDPTAIEASDEWIPLALELDIEPGSALDFSGFGQLDAPAGKHGCLIARPDGHLAFEKAPNTPRRFYGPNLCSSAHYVPHEQADRLAERLMRLGYNAVRFHHYERELVDRAVGNSTTLNKEKLDQLDYLFAALKKRGIYVTTDLYVSRPVFAHEVFPDAKGDLEMNEFKMLVPVNERAMENWKAFSRNLLTHVNPYTGLRYADDPALAWLAMINEGNFGNYTGGQSPRVRAEWEKAWNAWLADRAGEKKPWGAQPEFNIFLAEMEQRMFRVMRRFLREEVGTKVLLTNMNGWSNPIQNQAARQDYDYVDDHFYVDHPQFIEQRWRLPSRCENRSPVAQGAPGGRHCAFVRLFDKPFTLSEYNYSGPGRFRGVGGILTGCMAALQDWSVVWRFAYSHNRDNLFKPATAGYFDLATDPLNQAAERASLCLFLRGDLRPAPHALAIAMTEADLTGDSPRQANSAPSWHALALITRVGASLGATSADLALPISEKRKQGLGSGQALSLDPYGAKTGQDIVKALRERGWLNADNRTDLSANLLQSETGELTVDAPSDVLILNTPNTAGAYAAAGKTVTAGPVSITIEDTDATVWVSSLDGKPIAQSRRLLITHLTDLQNTGVRFGERARQTLLAWGKLPHLVRAGRATVRLPLTGRAPAEVWALATSGRRLQKVPTQRQDGLLTVPLSVKGADGARMMYEVVVSP